MLYLKLLTFFQLETRWDASDSKSINEQKPQKSCWSWQIQFIIDDWIFFLQELIRSLSYWDGKILRSIKQERYWLHYCAELAWTSSVGVGAMQCTWVGLQGFSLLVPASPSNPFDFLGEREHVRQASWRMHILVSCLEGICSNLQICTLPIDS